MADDKGWKNWETWNVNLWIDNEEPLYRAKVAWLQRQRPTAETVKAFTLDILPDGTPDFDDIREYERVDWSEIADHWQEYRELDLGQYDD